MTRIARVITARLSKLWLRATTTIFVNGSKITLFCAIYQIFSKFGQKRIYCNYRTKKQGCPTM